MAVKPTVDPKWSTTNNPADNIEPTTSLKNGGIPAGGVWGREFLNWQFYAISQWIDWVRSSALDKDNNLSDLTNAATARTNLGLNTSATTIGANTTGNAASATKLQTARTIGGVSFDGTANINLPGVNTAGNQDTSGNAATATYATSAGSAGSVTSMQPDLPNGLNSPRLMRNLSGATLNSGATVAASEVAFCVFNAAGAIFPTAAVLPTGTWKNVSGGNLQDDQFGLFVRIA